MLPKPLIGQTTWEELCRTWVLQQANEGNLPFDVEIVGSHWATDAQIDVVAINWREKAILLGECKWGLGKVNRKVIRTLIEKAPLVVPEDDWQVHFSFFARAGFTDDAREEASRVNAMLIALPQLDSDLRRYLLAQE